ncbi:hypothetical protein BJV85_003224 [Clostridium acetobutylicum]|uniref:Uncharacterized protein n=1 Tax=Clostridium acetobutylicum (strain ATCC 824 / DSM 792 / JCM 1419 / IAM 19013 / LMG 5710 / NBRC 13948 / NRRL B-527 / VKM B-1787 / 2291 / W) TaxID=272562 RepID=Q97KY1_CLOAB|nr:MULTISPECIES: DUF6143 family protein [Clostridium]AAK78761.1 Hypothetical protein CA_C0785 [Clostridium acetobutylicum ATCC 824]ADZ19835.1 Conserved hypothetical protein [Clostridium acetobutylicum EA 2018]AEI31439.1 hypothetical protein SMB_G0801 [Clostridium acetobutylicum DSM 1731]AWV80479.1 hypothetical protein DK921_10320 [Clostridium acetobutylicum]MBC2392669.1 hypothetical protein [Clostridium acetobutylicum]
MKYENQFFEDKSIVKKEVVSIPVSQEESVKGRYFVGQTGILGVDKGIGAWAGLINPCDSKIDLYAYVFTITNLSSEYLIAEVWLNTNLPQKGRISHRVSPTNTSLRPLPKNKVDIRFTDFTSELPCEGVNVYERIVPPKTTLVAEEDGKFIEGPNGNYVIVIKSLGASLSKAIVAFGWSEKPIY